MARSIWKGPFVDGYLLKKADAARGSGRSEVIKIWSRRSTILPQFIGLTFGVYNGQKHIPVYVTEEMIVEWIKEITMQDGENMIEKRLVEQLEALNKRQETPLPWLPQVFTPEF